MDNSSGDDRMIACCGLVCSECPAYLGTQANDAAKIAETADMWSKEYKADIKPEYVWCDGCRVEGKKCGHCAECDVRTCVLSKELLNCAHCAEFASCDKITTLHKLAPHAKKVILGIIESLK